MPHRSKALTVMHHARNYLVLQALFSDFLHTLFRVMDEYEEGPSYQTQATWIPLTIIGVSALWTTAAGYLNASYAKKNNDAHFGAEEYMATALSPPFSFFIWRLISGTDNMPLGWFIGTSAVCWLLSLPLLLKWSPPESSNKVTYIWDDRSVAQLNLPVYSEVSVAERRLNMGLRVGKSTVYAIAALMATLRRESSGKTEELTLPYYEALGVFFMASAWFVGKEVARHPNFAFVYLALLKGLEHFALTLNALSGLLFTVVVYFACGGKNYCASPTAEFWLTQASILPATLCATYTAITCAADAKDRHESNLLLLEKFSACRAMGARALQAVSSGLQAAKDRFAQCCQSAPQGTDEERFQMVS